MHQPGHPDHAGIQPSKVEGGRIHSHCLPGTSLTWDLGRYGDGYVGEAGGARLPLSSTCGEEGSFHPRPRGAVVLGSENETLELEGEGSFLTHMPGENY